MMDTKFQCKIKSWLSLKSLGAFSQIEIDFWFPGEVFSEEKSEICCLIGKV